MKKLLVVVAAILVVSILVVGCGEMVDTAISDSSEQVQRHESSSSQEKVQGAIETEPKTTISSSLGVTFEELILGPTGTGYRIVESSSADTEYPSSLEECILGPTGTGYRVTEFPDMEAEFPSSLEELMLGPTGTGYKSTDTP